MPNITYKYLSSSYSNKEDISLFKLSSWRAIPEAWRIAAISLQIIRKVSFASWAKLLVAVTLPGFIMIINDIFQDT